VNEFGAGAVTGMGSPQQPTSTRTVRRKRRLIFAGIAALIVIIGGVLAANLPIGDRAGRLTTTCVNGSDVNIPDDLQMQGFDLSSCDLTSVDLTGANLTDANLYLKRFEDTILTGVTVEGATLYPYAPPQGVISGGVIGTPSGGSLIAGRSGYKWLLANGYFVGAEANLAGVDLSNVDLQSIDLSSANLSGATLNTATLTGVVSGGITGDVGLPTGWTLVDGYPIGPDTETTDTETTDTETTDTETTDTETTDTETTDTETTDTETTDTT
jgi:hypothetical protein